VASEQAGALNYSGNGTSTSNTFSYSFTLADGDSYALAGSYNASYITGTVFSNALTLTYTGNTGGGGTTSLFSDNITVDLVQDIYDASGGTWNGLYTEVAPLCLGAGITAPTVQYEVNGNSVGNLGPYSSGCSANAASANLNNLGAINYLALDWDYAFDFSAGSAVNTAADVQYTPEPAETLPAALALGCLACVMIARKRREQAR
jgi:hypothetical protein